MSTAGIREFKARVSHHVRRAQAGVTVTITDRGRPIAVLGPIERVAVPAWVKALVADGGAEWSGGKPTGLARRVAGRGSPASRLVLDGRR